MERPGHVLGFPKCDGSCNVPCGSPKSVVLESLKEILASVQCEAVSQGSPYTSSACHLHLILSSGPGTASRTQTEKSF